MPNLYVDQPTSSEIRSRVNEMKRKTERDHVSELEALWTMLNEDAKNAIKRRGGGPSDA